MTANQPPWPREWLMTDERIGEGLWKAIARLPHGSGIVLRHFATPAVERARIGERIAQACAEHGLKLGVARDTALAEKLGAALVHNPGNPSPLPCSMSVHDRPQALAVRSAGAALAFVSPVHPTRSHPGAAALGPERAAVLAATTGCPAIALGGMNAARFAELDAAYPGAFYGYAGIDCWLE